MECYKHLKKLTYYEIGIIIKILDSKILNQSQLEKVFLDGEYLSGIISKQLLSDQVEFLEILYNSEQFTKMKN